MKKYSFIAVIAVLLAIPSLRASAGDGNAALPFVRVNHNPVSAAMGGAGIVNASAYSSFSNTAAVTYWDKTLDVAASYQAPTSFDTHDMNIGAAWRLGNVALTIGGNYQLGDSYEVFDSNGAENGTFSPSQMQINLGAAWKFLPYLSVGADFKYLSNTVASGSSLNAFAADVFLMTKLSDFRIAAGVSSIGTAVKDAAGNSFSLPTSVTVAGGYDHEFGKNGLNVALDLDYYYSLSDFTASIGAEYNYNKIGFVRLGYHYGADTAVIPSYFSFGIGGQYYGVRLDIAYQMAMGSSNLMNDILSIGLGYSF